MRLFTGHEKELGLDVDAYDIDEVLKLVDSRAFLQAEYDIEFQQAGTELRALCPLPSHDERTASFYLNPEKGLWRCYGCGSKGSMVGLVMRIEQCSKSDAVMRLAVAAGYDPIPDPNAALDRLDRAVTKLVQDFLARQASVLPGHLPPLRFMDTVRQRLEGYAQRRGDADAAAWIESVYMRMDDVLLAEDAQGAHRLWDGLAKEYKALPPQAVKETVEDAPEQP